MALSDHDRYKNIPSPRKRAVNAETNRHWSDSQKIEAVTTYLALGEVRLTASVLKIPEVTIHSWKSKQWWKDIEGELRLQEDLQLSTRLKKIIDKSFDQVEDRLSNGDFIYDQKTGQLVRKPVSMKDAHKVAVDLVDKRDILINKVPQSSSVEAIEDKLQKLAEKFAQIVNQAKPPIEVTDVVFAKEESVSEADEDGGRPLDDDRRRADTVGEWVDNDSDGILDGGDSEGEEGTPSQDVPKNV